MSSNLSGESEGWALAALCDRWRAMSQCNQQFLFSRNFLGDLRGNK